MLNKDFCLFTREARYVLVASTRPTVVQDTARWLRQYPETLKNNIIPVLEDITIYAVDMVRPHPATCSFWLILSAKPGHHSCTILPSFYFP